jgi:GDP-L-fucose synthase
VKKPTLLLTGGSGMVGRNILEHPSADNWHIISPSSHDLDLTNSEMVKTFIKKNPPDIIVHAAGQVGGIQANIDEPVNFLERNLAIGRNIIMESHKAGVRKFLNLASTCMYPRAAQNPLSEKMILTGELEPTNEGYALAKIVATRLCQYIRLENPSALYKTLIPCNLFGRYDTFDPKSSHLLPAIIYKIHEAKVTGKNSVEIWGDGAARREFMYAGDLADAVLMAALDITSIPDLMNCGLGHDYSISDYYHFVAEVIGWDGEFTYDLNKPVGMRQKLCSIERQESWGWSAPTELKRAISLTYNFYLNGAKI